jgi:pimeloyl-ACP methyl ester carboxylesterase
VSALKGSRLVVYNDGGHSLHWEEPERFAADVAKFIESNIKKQE